jgi:hypothetical protein
MNERTREVSQNGMDRYDFADLILYTSSDDKFGPVHAEVKLVLISLRVYATQTPPERRTCCPQNPPRISKIIPGMLDGTTSKTF